MIPRRSSPLRPDGSRAAGSSSALLRPASWSPAVRTTRAPLHPGPPAREGSPPPDGSSAAAGTYIIVQRFPQDVQEPGTIRLPISLATSDGQLIQDGPDELGAQVTDIDGKPVGEPITAQRRDVVPGPYYAFRTEVADPGVYYLVVDGRSGRGRRVPDHGRRDRRGARTRSTAPAVRHPDRRRCPRRGPDLHQ